MSLLKPSQIYNVLKETNLRPETKEDESLTDLLERSNLGKREVLDTLGSLMRGADTSAVRLQSAKTAMQLHGLLDGENGVQVPIVNIIIHDSEFSMNPILIPR